MVGRRWLSVVLSVLMTVVLFGVAAQAETAVPGGRGSGSGLFLMVQGKELRGDRPDGGIDLLGYSHEVSVSGPREAGSGLATGRRQHSPLTIHKAVDKTSPLLMKALVSNQRLNMVRLGYAGPDGRLLYTIALTDAQIISVAQEAGEGERPTERISFTYNEIEWSWVEGGVQASDEIRTPR